MRVRIGAPGEAWGVTFERALRGPSAAKQARPFGPACMSDQTLAVSHRYPMGPMSDTGQAAEARRLLAAGLRGLLSIESSGRMDTRAAPSTLPARIGIVEDDAILRRSLEETVAAIDGLELVGSVGTLAEGLRLLTRPPDLLLVDLALPDGTGLDLIRKVHASANVCKILVLSLFGDVRNVVSAIEAGADGYVLKGADAMEVSLAIQTVLAGGAPISPAVAVHILSRLRAGKNAAEQPLPSPRMPATKAPLTNKEVEILEALAKGLSFKDVAGLLSISPHTVSDHVKAIYRKLEVTSRGEAVFEGLSTGIISLHPPES